MSACAESETPSSRERDTNERVIEDAGPSCVIEGAYGGTAAVVSGSCGDVMAGSIDVSFGPSGVLTTAEMRLNQRITTMTVVKGCTVRLTREVVAFDGALLERLYADSLALQPDDTLVGEATLTRFNDDIPAGIECEGSYELRLGPTGP